MALLGEDGRGYDLARRLESAGVWRTWLGDSLYSTFHHHLSSPSSWDAFMTVDDSKSRAQIQLQLRARALLFDKASATLFFRSETTPNSSSCTTSSSSLVAVSKLSHNYLQLHGDDVYYTLENVSQDGAGSNPTSLKSQSKSSFRGGSRGNESDFSNLSQRSRNDELPENWYNQFIAKYGFKYGMSVGDRESDKRTPEGMSAYLKAANKHKRKRVPFQEDQSIGFGNSADDDVLFLPETMFRMNCVPDSALPPIRRTVDKPRIQFHGVLDNLPRISTRSPVMIERLGIMPEYLSVERRGVLRHGRVDKMSLSEDQAIQMSRKVVARMLISAGFEGATEVPVDVFSQLLIQHACKLGRILKVLTDSYRKQCSPIELLKMFLHTTGSSNLRSLLEIVKDSPKNFAPQNQQQAHVLHSPMNMQQQTSARLPQQIPRQMQQMVHPQNPTLQQQQQLMRRRQQVTSPRLNMEPDKDRPLVQVKLEAPSELPMDRNNTFNPMSLRHQQQQMQYRQQQMAAMANLHPQTNNQFRQLVNMQVPPLQSPNTGMARAPPVKVEGFQELMGGDSSLKLDSDDKLTSPNSK